MVTHSLTWLHTPALWRQRQAHLCETEAGTVCQSRPCFKKKRKRKENDILSDPMKTQIGIEGNMAKLFMIFRSFMMRNSENTQVPHGCPGTQTYIREAKWGRDACHLTVERLWPKASWITSGDKDRQTTWQDPVPDKHQPPSPRNVQGWKKNLVKSKLS